MTDTELLQAVKDRLLITGEFHDGALKGYIQDVKDYLLDSGVKEGVVNDKVSVGVITRGVSDLWNYGAGNGEFSKIFYERAIQLCYKEVVENV